MSVECLSNLKSSVPGNIDVRALHKPNYIEASDIDKAGNMFDSIKDRLVQLEMPFRAERMARFLEFKRNAPDVHYSGSGKLHMDIRYNLFKPVNFGMNDIHGLYESMSRVYSKTLGSLNNIPVAEWFRASVTDVFQKRLDVINLAMAEEQGEIISCNIFTDLRFNNPSYNDMLDLTVTLSGVDIVKVR